MIYLAIFSIIRGKRKAQQASNQSELKRTQANSSELKRTQANSSELKRTQQAKAKAIASEHKRTMSNPKSFMEPIWEQDKDAGYDFSDEAYAADNAYYSKYGGNTCIVCMGGSYIRRVNINTKAASAASASSAASAYSKYDGGNADDYYEEEEYYEDEEDYEDDTNDY
jgi:hypothetical protein